MQQGRGALKEHLDGCPKQGHLVEIQPKAAARQPQAMVQQKGHSPDSFVEHEGEEGVVDEIAVHDAAPEEVSI